jgi:ABC-2 type transporter
MTAIRVHQPPKPAPIPLWSGTRPAPPTRLAASLTFLTRGLIKLRRVPEQAADAVLIPVIFTVLFTYLFGGALAGSTGRYLHFLLPGTLVMTVLLVTVYAGVGLNMDKTRGVSDRFRSLPLWRPAHIAGALLTEGARALVASAIVIALGLIMGFRPDGGISGVVSAMAVVVVFGMSLAWTWAAIGLVLRTAAAVSTLSFLVQFPLVELLKRLACGEARGLDPALAAVALAGGDLGGQQRLGEALVAPLLFAGAVGELGSARAAAGALSARNRWASSEALVMPESARRSG